MNSLRDTHVGKSDLEKGRYTKMIRKLSNDATTEQTMYTFQDTDVISEPEITRTKRPVSWEYRISEFFNNHMAGVIKSIIIIIVGSILVYYLTTINRDFGRFEAQLIQTTEISKDNEKEIKRFKERNMDMLDKIRDAIAELKVSIAKLEVTLGLKEKIANSTKTSK